MDDHRAMLALSLVPVEASSDRFKGRPVTGGCLNSGPDEPATFSGLT